MKEFFKKNIFSIIGIVIIIFPSFYSSYLYFKLNNLKKDADVLNQKYTKAVEEIKAKDAQLTEKDKEIENLKQAKNNSIRSDVESDTEANASENSSSISDKINGSDDFKNKINSALSLMQAQDGEHYQVVMSQVSTINEYDNYGGYQEKRNIYIGADANAAITASLISHEAQHVYNVYVSGIWSYHTKEQELPCYEAELVTAQRTGAPAFFIQSVQDNINYWQSQ